MQIRGSSKTEGRYSELYHCTDGPRGKTERQTANIIQRGQSNQQSDDRAFAIIPQAVYVKQILLPLQEQ
jgi:hypothetical protein